MCRSLARAILLGGLLLGSASCASSAGNPTIPVAATGKPYSAPVPSTATPVRAVASADFRQWVDGFKAEARGKGISQATLDDAFADVAPIPRVIELDRKQPETTMTFARYQERVVNEARVQRGRQLLAENRTILDKVSAQYGVPAQVVVALWGIESDFGRLTGGFNVVGALATLAYDGRRSTFFRGELLKAVRILDEDHLPASQMTGSWAGAMGQCQFMPSSFLAHAVDFDGDGRRNIWTSRPDVFASAANYLAEAGWRRGEAWGFRAAVPARLDKSLVSLDVKKSAADWARLGVRATGPGMPAKAQMLSLVLPGGADGPAFLVGENYRVILRWNRSSYFATAVGSLADRIVAQ